MQGELITTTNGLGELIERESRIERAQRNAYYEIGLELKAIRDRELYKSQRKVTVAGRYSFVTFEEYVTERWDMDDSRARRLIMAAEAAQKLESVTIGTVLPSRESHVRELLKLESDDDRAAVWQSVIDRGETINARIISEEVELFNARKAKNWFTLDEWQLLDASAQEKHLNAKSSATFNKQDTTSIEWAQWSWNPITGCKHDCPYCYARDIANRFYPQKFEPSLYPERLWAPVNTKVPDAAKSSVAFKNVFTGSMADMFGRWVPREWIDLVMNEVRDNKQWNFLFLTKFPNRFAELDAFPKNAWMGTTVDCQSRVANAEKAFSRIGGGTKWLSVEPMLTPLKFKKLDLFDWIVIGGASKQSQTPKWVPPIDWVVDLHSQARHAGCSIYYKDNMDMSDDLRIREFPWITSDTKILPESLVYSGIAK